MQKPKFRLFGGPNGSGKTHVFNRFKKLGIIHTEIYVNADRIEAQIKDTYRFSFNAYRVKVSDREFKQHILQSGLYSKMADKNFIEKFFIRSGVLKITNNITINSYHASFIAAYLAEKLLQTGQSFAFETVMSHKSKIELLYKAKEAGYKTYLYFVFTNSIEMNITRIQLRVLRGEHNVKEETIRSRAARTFGLLPQAFVLAESAYIIDNSNEAKVILSKEDKVIKKAEHFPDIIKEAVAKIAESSK